MQTRFREKMVRATQKVWGVERRCTHAKTSRKRTPTQKTIPKNRQTDVATHI